MPEPAEQPWMPTAADTPFSFTLVNPEGDRHLAFDEESGQWFRLWEYREPQPLHTGKAVLLRPSDVDTIIRVSSAWAMRYQRKPRAESLIDELAEGVKQLVLYFAGSGR